MNEIPANVLLQRYCHEEDDGAFRELVSRYIGLVYGTALRRVGGDVHLAQDIVQLTFTDLARKASSIPPTTPVAGWLHQNTCFRAAGIVRSEQRRQAREQKAAHMESIDREDSASWTRLAPLLDEGLERLPSRLRDALLLRFCEGRDFSSIAKTLGISDDAAQKRVSRGLEQLRSFFVRRGVATATGSLAASLSAQAISAPPAGFAAIVAQNSLLSAAASTTAISAILFMATKTKLALGVAVVVAAGFMIVSQQRETKRLRNELASAREAATSRVSASNSTEKRPLLDQNPTSAALPRDQLEQDVLEAARDRLWRTDGKRWQALIASIPIADLKGILDTIQRSTNAEVRRVAREELVARWARTDPKAASAWCDVLPVSAETSSLKGHVSEIWMDADPDVAMKRGATAAHDIGAMARHDVQAAASHVLSLASSAEREHGLAMIGHLWAERDPEGAVRWLQTLQSREDLLMAFRGMANRLAEVAPANVGLYLETFATDKKFSEVGREFAVCWANVDPLAAAKWAATLPSATEMRARAMAGIADAWALSDPTAVAEWLKPLPRDEAKDKAISQFVSSASAYNPRLAAALAGEMGDPVMRSAAVAQILRHWSNLDRAAASHWLENLSFLNPAEKRQLAQTVSPPR
jgi:RNA polymerase sigma factor (sigma-70 family)